jgi:hypothetical protein
METPSVAVEAAVLLVRVIYPGVAACEREKADHRQNDRLALENRGGEGPISAKRPRRHLPTPPTPLFARLLIIGHALDILRQTLFFAHFLKTAQHLLRRLITA